MEKINKIKKIKNFLRQLYKILRRKNKRGFFRVLNFENI